MRLAYHVMAAPTPLGLLFLAASDRGVRHVSFMDRRSLKRTLAAHEALSPDAQWEASVLGLRPYADQLDQYFTGTCKELEWPLDLAGDALAQSVWRALRRVPYGRTCTVAELAREVGQPRNLRAVAQAVLTNPLAIVVPCHRVLGADGKPSNYVGGLPRKKYLLALEERFRPMGGLDDNRVIGELVRRVEPAPAKRSPIRRVTPKRRTATARVASTRATTTARSAKKRAR
jgi:O-6-methylguanine DNA methyltransferase